MLEYRIYRATFCLILCVFASITSKCTKVYAFTPPTNKATFISAGTLSTSSPLFRKIQRNVQSQMTNKGGMVEERQRKRYIPKKVVDTYVNYVTKLWKQTDPIEREKVAAQKALAAVKRVKHILEGKEYVNLSDVQDNDTLDRIAARIEAKDKLLESCNEMLKYIDTNDGNQANATLVSEEEAVATIDNAVPVKKKSRSVLFGAAMGALVACWVFSGNVIFTALFTLMSVLGQLEYYRMVMKAGIYPARKISVLGACAMFVTALSAPQLHQICLPIFGTYAMIWFLTMRRKIASISEIATTFTGMFYLGYIPSFWVRIRLIENASEVTRISPIIGPFLESMGSIAKDVLPSSFLKYCSNPITTGAVFIFWSWISIAFSDVGAYFAGRKFGKTKLDKIAPAAGAASPNKTIEGFLGGTLTSIMFASTGAYLMKWPMWFVTGPFHGIMLAFLGLVGDLTASMLKRDSGLKDFGDLLPEHGGIMDRVDSYIFTAPYSWLVCQFIIPSLKAM